MVDGQMSHLSRLQKTLAQESQVVLGGASRALKPLGKRADDRCLDVANDTHGLYRSSSTQENAEATGQRLADCACRHVSLHLGPGLVLATRMLPSPAYQTTRGA